MTLPGDLNSQGASGGSRRSLAIEQRVQCSPYSGGPFLSLVKLAQDSELFQIEVEKSCKMTKSLLRNIKKMHSSQKTLPATCLNLSSIVRLVKASKSVGQMIWTKNMAQYGYDYFPIAANGVISSSDRLIFESV